MLDKKIIGVKIANLQHYKKEIERFLPKDAKIYCKSDLPIKRLVERDLGLISDIEYDLLALLYKGLEIAVSGDEGSMLQKLSGRLGTRLTNKIEGLRVLRNNLMHAYVEYNYDTEVYKQASDLDSLSDFIGEIKTLVQNSK